MPQLDFFTFTHQFLLLIITFCGLYYFNLTVLSFGARFHELEKYFFLGFLAFHALYFNSMVTACTQIILKIYLNQLERYRHYNYNLIKQLFFFNVGVEGSWRSSRRPNIKEIILLAFLSWLMLYYFTTNIMVFNAEKLMFIYFCIVLILIFLFVKNIIVLNLKTDLTAFVESLIEIEATYATSLKLVLKLNAFVYNYLLRKIKTSFLVNNIKGKLILNNNAKI